MTDIDQALKEFIDVWNPLNILGFGDLDDEPDSEDKKKDKTAELSEEIGLSSTSINLDQDSNLAIMQFLGEAVHPQEAKDFQFQSVLDRLGKFFYFKAFADMEAIDEYTSQPGYGYDEDKPGLCFAFGIK